MAANYVKQGLSLTFVNTGTEIKSGDVVVVSNLIGVAEVDIPATTGSGTVAISGVFTVPKVTGSAWTQGAELLYDVSAAKFDVGTATADTGDISGCCVAASAALSADNFGKVLLNVGMGIIN